MTITDAKKKVYIQNCSEMMQASLDFLDDLLPWSDKLPAECRKVIDGN